jgi:tRNA threonylcarbamoyladenosine biosynthesis protein TsaE
MNKNYSLENLAEIASLIISNAKNKTILFYGEMGVGKTTLIKEICKQLEVVDTISSPTFSLVNEYKTSKNISIYHFDFYRITNQEEALDMGD